MKFLLKFLLAVVFVCVVLVFFAGGGLVKYMINFHSERLTGLQMTVAGAEVNWMGGQLVLNNLAIANPPGFKNAHAATIENIQVKLQPKTLLEDVVVVDYVGITGTRFQFEGDLNKNNVQEIQAVLNEKVAEAAQAEEHDSYDEGMTTAVAEKDKDGKKFAVRQLLVKDTTLTFHLGEMAQGVSTQVSDLELTNIGTADNGATLAEVLNKILVPLFNNMQKQIVKTMSDPQGLLDQVKDKIGGMLDGLF